MLATDRAIALVLGVTLAACNRTPATNNPTATSRPTPRGVSSSSHTDLRFADLPPPFATPDSNNASVVVPPSDRDRLVLPHGFAAATYADGGLEEPRWLALAPNHDVFLSDSKAGTVFLFRGLDAKGAAKERFTFATGLNKPFGMAVLGGYLYVGDTNAVLRFAYEADQTQARGEPEKIADLPGRGYHEHWTRNVVPSPDGTKLYVTIGSSTNVDAEPDPERASILEMNPDGTGRRIFANGTRNPIGLAFYPGTTQIWAAVQERDRLGDDLVPDYLVAVKDSGFYGWPFAYLGPHPEPRHQGERPDLVAKTLPPDVLFQAHSAVLGLVFYEGSMFPKDWRGDAIVAFHGSWNRSQRTGYKLVRVRFHDGRPLGGYDDFVTGWMRDPSAREVWGRPVGLLVMPDGSLLVADDGANKIWRVTYEP
jgi:glucose/arabinose dehydrogenase